MTLPQYRNRWCLVALLLAAISVLLFVSPSIAAKHDGGTNNSPACPQGVTYPLILDIEDYTILSNGYVCLVFQKNSPPSVTVLAGDFYGTGNYGKNTLATAGIRFEREDPQGNVHMQQQCGASVTVLLNSSTSVAFQAAGIADGCGSDASAQETWTLTLTNDSRYVSFSATGGILQSTMSKAVRRSMYFSPSSIYGLYDRGVMQMKGATPSSDFYPSFDCLSRFYALGGVGDDLSSAGDFCLSVRRQCDGANQVLPTVLLSSSSGIPYWSGFQEVLAGNFTASTDTWCTGWNLQTGVTIPASAMWTSSAQWFPNSKDFPTDTLPDSASASSGIPADDLHTILTGIYASPVGNLFTHDNAVSPGVRVAQIATTIHRPDVGYSDTYNYFDPDNYLSTYALLSSGDTYLQQQVRACIERSGAYINEKGQLPHHFVGIVPTYQALSGATQTGPNVFWVLSALNYAKFSGDTEWLDSYIVTLRNASSFLFDLIDPNFQLLNAPGSLYIDVFIRNNFTSDSNAMLVGFFQEFADAEDAVGNTTGATLLRALSVKLQAAINQHLWFQDHYITQRNPDGTSRDFIDYDSNLIAVAHGVPPNASVAKAVLARVDSGRCTHGRATFVSELYYGPNDCTNGNIGDSWCSMGRNGWFDALSRRRYGDQTTFDDKILNPLAADVRRWTWLHERYACDGTPQRNRTWAYFEYPSVASIMMSQVRYGVNMGFNSLTVDPLGPSKFDFAVGHVEVFYSRTSVRVKVPGYTTVGIAQSRVLTFTGMTPGTYQVSQETCPDTPTPFTVIVGEDGVLTFSAVVVRQGLRCVTMATLSP